LSHRAPESVPETRKKRIQEHLKTLFCVPAEELIWLKRQLFHMEQSGHLALGSAACGSGAGGPSIEHGHGLHRILWHSY
jgi:hypothetical protein